MVLAAGHGTRLGDLGRQIPKVLVDIGGEPLLARQIRYLQASGIERIVVNAHHLADQVRRFAAAHPSATEIDVVVEAELLGTAGGVRNALPLLGRAPFVVLYGDVMIDEPIQPMVELHERLEAVATLTVYASRAVEGKGVVEFDSAGVVSAFHEKATATVTEQAYINAGLYVIDPSTVADLPPGSALDFGHDVFPGLLDRGATLAAYELGSPVLDIGTPEALSRARE